MCCNWFLLIVHYREESGRHVVALPLQPAVEEIESSREAALHRFTLQERNLGKLDVFSNLGDQIEMNRSKTLGQNCLYKHKQIRPHYHNVYHIWFECNGAIIVGKIMNVYTIFIRHWLMDVLN